MKSHAHFLSHQIARFGALTIPQMRWLCSERCKKTALYDTIKDWSQLGLIERVAHPMKAILAYTAGPKLYQLVYGTDHERRIGVRMTELQHSVQCANAFIELSRYANVTGIASEYEIDPSDSKDFCYGRVPDGIIQLSHGDLSFELAVEVETSKKSDAKMEGLFSAYRQTLLRDMPCAGVLIVAGDQEILGRYQRKLHELPPELEQRVLLADLEGLKSLKPEYFGERTSGPGQVLTLFRNSSAGVGTYGPLKSEDFTCVQAS